MILKPLTLRLAAKLCAVMTVSAFTGCTDKVVDPKSSAPNPVEQFGASLFSVSDTTRIDALVRFAGGRFNEGAGSRYDRVANAVFTNDRGPISVTSVSLNGQALAAGSAGFYSNLDPGVPDNGDSLIWAVAGYSGASFTIKAPKATPLSVTNIAALDTISKTSGKTLVYSGWQGDSVRVSLFADPAFTWQLIDSVAAHSGANPSMSIIASDIGTVALTRTALGVLESGKYYVLKIDHEKYAVTVGPDGKTIGTYSSYEYSLPVYIAP